MNQIYVTNDRSDTVSVIDASNTVIDTIFVGDAPFDVVFSPDGTYAYVTNSAASTISVVTVSPATPISVTPPEFSTGTAGTDGDAPQGVALSLDGGHAFVTNFDSGTVSVINTVSNAIEETIDVEDGANGVVLSRDGAHAYVANTDSDSVSVIDADTFDVITTIAVGDAPWNLAVNPDGSRVYVANGNDTVSVIDTRTNTVIGSLNTDDPIDIAFSPDGTRAYVTNFSDDAVTVFDATTYNVLTTITVGDAPTGVAVSPDGTRVYVTNTASDSVTVIDGDTNEVLTTVNVGDFSADVAVSGDGIYVYVTNFGSDTMSVIDTRINIVVATVFVGDRPSDVEVSADGTQVYVPNLGSNTLSVVTVDAERVGLEFEGLVGPADEFRLCALQFRQRGVARDGRSGVDVQLRKILNQVDENQIGARVGLPPGAVCARPAESTEPAWAEQLARFRRVCHE